MPIKRGRHGTPTCAAARCRAQRRRPGERSSTWAADRERGGDQSARTSVGPLGAVGMESGHGNAKVCRAGRDKEKKKQNKKKRKKKGRRAMVTQPGRRDEAPSVRTRDAAPFSPHSPARRIRRPPAPRVTPTRARANSRPRRRLVGQRRTCPIAPPKRPPSRRMSAVGSSRPFLAAFERAGCS